MQGQGRAESTTRVHNRVEDRKGRAERRAWQEGKTEWKARVRAGNGMSGQGRATYGRARNGMARQEQGQEHIQRRAGKGSGRAVAGTGACADSKQSRAGQGNSRDRAGPGVGQEQRQRQGPTVAGPR